jgi:hypothetical protein
MARLECISEAGLLVRASVSCRLVSQADIQTHRAYWQQAHLGCRDIVRQRLTLSGYSRDDKTKYDQVVSGQLHGNVVEVLFMLRFREVLARFISWASYALCNQLIVDFSWASETNFLHRNLWFSRHPQLDQTCMMAFTLRSLADVMIGRTY